MSLREPPFPLLTRGHGFVVLPGTPAATSIAVDPWRVENDEPRAALVLLTDGKVDRSAVSNVGAVIDATSTIIVPSTSNDRLSSAFGDRVRGVTAGDEFASNGGARVTVLPAEGPPRARGFYPRGAGLTYLVTTAHGTALFLGASAALAEHAALAPDVAFFAVGGFHLMDPDEAAESAVRVAPKLAIPVAWGDLAARHAAARRFVELCEARGIAARAVVGEPHKPSVPNP